MHICNRCMYIHISTYVCISVCLYICTYTYRYTNTQTHTHTHTHTHTQGQQEDLLCLFTFIDGVTTLSDGGEEIACPFVSVRGFCTAYARNWQNQLRSLIGGVGHLIKTNNFIHMDLTDR